MVELFLEFVRHGVIAVAHLEDSNRLELDLFWAELVQEAGRSLEVCEEEGDGAGGEILSHDAILR
jgi:hypothetical protein